MRKFCLLLITLSVISCSKKSLEKDIFSFDFSSQYPAYITINDNESGELLAFKKLVKPKFKMLVDSDGTEKLYNVNFVGAAGGYEPGTVKVLSYRDISPGVITTAERDSFWYDYKKIQYTPKGEIENFLNSKNHFYAKEGYVELGWQSYSSKFDLVLLKIKDESKHRYHFIEDLSVFEKDEVDVFSLPMVEDYQNIKLIENANSVRFIIFGRSNSDGSIRPNIYDSHKSDFKLTKSFDFPVLDLPIEYFTRVQIRTDIAISNGFVKGIPESIEMPAYSFELKNSLLSDFKILKNDADHGEFVFNVGASVWRVFDDNSNGSDFVKAEMPEELTSIFPDLLSEGELISVNLVYYEADNTLTYREMALPVDRVDGYEYGVWRIKKGYLPLYRTISLYQF